MFEYLVQILQILYIHYVRMRRWFEFWQVKAWFENNSGKRMIRSGFLSCAERLELEVCMRSQREDHGVARQANTLLLLDDGKPYQVIAEFLYLDDDTIRGWHKTYREGG